MDWWRVEGARILIDLFRKQKQPAKAAAALAGLRTHEPKEGFGGAYYRQAARVAELTGAKADAVVYYQAALDKWDRRMSQPEEIRAIIDRLWKELGGSEETRRILGSQGPRRRARAWIRDGRNPKHRSRPSNFRAREASCGS
jgi:hypothetical protein